MGCLTSLPPPLPPRPSQPTFGAGPAVPGAQGGSGEQSSGPSPSRRGRRAPGLPRLQRLCYSPGGAAERVLRPAAPPLPGPRSSGLATGTKALSPSARPREGAAGGEGARSPRCPLSPGNLGRFNSPPVPTRRRSEEIISSLSGFLRAGEFLRLCPKASALSSSEKKNPTPRRVSSAACSIPGRTELCRLQASVDRIRSREPSGNAAERCPPAGSRLPGEPVQPRLRRDQRCGKGGKFRLQNKLG